MMPEAGNLLARFDAGDPDALQAVVVAACHAEDAYAIAHRSSGSLDAARVAMARAFLRSLAVGEPENTKSI